MSNFEDYHMMNNHSMIIDYPINKKLFPNTDKVKFIELTLNKNEYLLIPDGWFHWVYTEPKTVAISFEIRRLEGNKNNILFEHIVKNKYFKNKGLLYDINYNNFIDSILNEDVRALFSSTNDLSPVYKNEYFKTFETNKLKNIILINNKFNYHTYLGSLDLTSNPSWENFKVLRNFINFGNDIVVNYMPTVWINLDKRVNSGLHFDSTNRVLYVVEGQKKIILAPPEEKENLYLKNMFRVSSY
jgi:hypothetical protein